MRRHVTTLSALPIARARSDAESRALERLAGGPPPRLNHRIAGEEADLIFDDRRLIVEIDGPHYHRFADEDERKERAWRASGDDVLRVPSHAVYDD
ncbi:MAG: hypothetical protein JWM71_1403 [Solirubrobacteraceae bacterium]|nr:hypothetical protein [Solirubrobacteraceae bacterium]